MFDMESNLWCLARRRAPLDALKDKLDVYAAEGHIRADEKDGYVQVFEDHLGHHREINLHGSQHGAGNATTTEPDKENKVMNEEEL